jgi:hypothetical protein
MKDKLLKKGFVKNEPSRSLAIQTHSGEKYQKEFIDLSMNEKDIYFNVNVILNVSSTEKNIEQINKINEALKILSEDKLCKSWLNGK